MPSRHTWVAADSFLRGQYDWFAIDGRAIGAAINPEIEPLTFEGVRSLLGGGAREGETLEASSAADGIDMERITSSSNVENLESRAGWTVLLGVGDIIPEGMDVTQNLPIGSWAAAVVSPLSDHSWYALPLTVAVSHRDDGGNVASTGPIPPAAANLEEPVYNGSGDPSVAVTASSNSIVNALLSGVRWSDGFITYSDVDSPADYQVGYYSDGNDADTTSAQNEGFSQISAQQLLAAHFGLNAATYTQPLGAFGFSVEGFTNLLIDYAGAGLGTSTIRLANSSDPGTAYAYYPSVNVTGGDVWFGPSGRTPVAGNYHWHTTIHEIGHALGLKHAHETGVFGALPSAWDSMEFTVMTYRSFVGDDIAGYNNELFGYAQTYMMLDIAALQYMYGADFTINGGNTVYTWDPTNGQSFVDGVLAISPGGNRIFTTIWDGNGVDTYNLSNYSTNLRVDLRPGENSTFSSAQIAFLGGGPNSGFARGNVFNALQFDGDARSLIENAIGGSGSDTFAGNVANNTFTGNGGTDTVIFAGTRSQFTFTETNGYVVTGASQGIDTLNGIERFQFNDIFVTDDRIGGTATTQSVVLAGSGTGDVQFFGDRDWFRITLTAGVAISIDLKGSATGSGTLVDPYLYLYNNAGQLIAQDDDTGVSVNSRLVYTPGVSGDYYIGAGAFNDNSLGTYQLSVGRAGASRGSDLNGDATSDILLQNASTGDCYVWLLNGTSLVGNGSVGWTPGSEWQHRNGGDFNGDGRSDVLLQNASTGDCYVWLVNGTSLVGNGSVGWTPGAAWQAKASGDFNGDGKADVLLQNVNTGDCYVWLLNGTNLVGNGNVGWTPGAAWQAKASGDFNGDGKADVLLQNVNTGDCYVWLLNGTNLVGNGSAGWTPGAAWQAKSSGDFNGDGKSDILLQNVNTGDCYLWLLNGTNLVGNGNAGWTPGAAWEAKSSGDFNGDGKSDVLLQNVNTGDCYLWLLNGTNLVGNGYAGWTPGPSWDVL